MANIEFDLTLAIKDFQANLNKVNAQIDSFQKDFNKKVSTANLAFGSFIGNFAANAAGRLIENFGAVAIDTFSSIVEEGSRLESVTQQFATLTGSVETATTLINELRNAAARTPFELGDLQEASKRLLAIGTNAKDVVPLLLRLGDVASVGSGDINGLTAAFAKAYSQGRVTAETFETLTNQSPVLAKALVDAAGVNGVGGLRKAMEDGRVTSDVLLKAITNLTSEGGTAFGGMQKQASTLNGIISNINDTFSNLAADVGIAVLPTLKELALTFIGLIDRNKEFFKSFAVGTIKLAGDALNGLLGIIQSVIKAYETFIGIITLNQQTLDEISTEVNDQISLWETFATVLDNRIAQAITVVTTLFGFMAVKLGVIQGAFSLLSSVVARLLTSFFGMAIVKGILSAIAGAVAALLTPVGLVVAALTALSAAGYYFLVTKQEEFTILRKNLEGLQTPLEDYTRAQQKAAKESSDAILNQIGLIDTLNEAQGKAVSRQAIPLLPPDQLKTADDNRAVVDLATNKKIAEQRKQLAIQLNEIEAQRNIASFEASTQANSQAIDLQKQLLQGISEENMAEFQNRIKNEADMQALSNQQMLQMAYDAEVAKADQQFALDEMKAQTLATRAEQEIAIEDAKNKRILALNTAKSKQEQATLKLSSQNYQKAKQAELQVEQETARLKNQIYQSTMQAGSEAVMAIAQATGASASATFFLSKAIAATQVLIQDGMARASAMAVALQASLASGPAAPAVFASTLAGLNSLITTNTAIQLGAIAATTLAARINMDKQGVRRATGGFIPGNSLSGDRVMANVNSGEVVLNSSQQREFMRLANGGSAGGLMEELVDRIENAIMSQNVVLVANDTELARSVSRGVMNGIVIGRSR